MKIFIFQASLYAGHFIIDRFKSGFSFVPSTKVAKIKSNKKRMKRHKIDKPIQIKNQFNSPFQYDQIQNETFKQGIK